MVNFIRIFPARGLPAPAEKGEEHNPTDKTPDMAPPGDTAPGLGRAQGKSPGDYLHEEPEADVDESGYLNKNRKKEDQDEGYNPGSGEHDDIGAHDSGNGSRGPESRDHGMDIHHKIDNTSRDPGNEIKEQKSPMAEAILQSAAKEVEEPHISDEVQPSPVQKHVS